MNNKVQINQSGVSATTKSDSSLNLNQPSLNEPLIDTALYKYSDEQLNSLLVDLQKFDEDSYTWAAHSAAVKD